MVREFSEYIKRRFHLKECVGLSQGESLVQISSRLGKYIAELDYERIISKLENINIFPLFKKYLISMILRTGNFQALSWEEF